MKHFKLKRVAYIADGTFGVLFDEEIPFCLTVEREWKNNQRNISCIPTGFYLCGGGRDLAQVHRLFQKYPQI